jgi:hypothetical protein
MTGLILLRPRQSLAARDVIISNRTSTTMSVTDVIQLMRPRQWTKNAAVFAGIVFA